MPLGYERVIFFSSYPFPYEFAYVCHFCSQSVQLFGFFPTFLNLCPPDPLQMPLGARGVTFFSLCQFPDKSVYVCQFNFVPVGLEAFPDLLIDDPLTPPPTPLGYQGVKFELMSIPRFVCQIWSRSVQLFGIFPTFVLMCAPLTPSKYPLGLERLICLADVHSQNNLHEWVKVGPDRSSGLEAFPGTLDDPLTPMPLGY